jgi:hypothetical protein
MANEPGAVLGVVNGGVESAGAGADSGGRMLGGGGRGAPGGGIGVASAFARAGGGGGF